MHVTVLAANTTTALAKATAKATTTSGSSGGTGGSGGSGGSNSVGVGASVALNLLLTNLTRAEVVDGAVLTGGHDVTIRATSTGVAGPCASATDTAAICTYTEAGSAGSIAVRLALVAVYAWVSV